MTKFCVIGKTAGRTASDHKRTWFDTEKEAVDHAKALIKAQVLKNGVRSQQLFVVQAIKVIETGVPKIDVRDIEVGDDIPSDEEED